VADLFVERHWRYQRIAISLSSQARITRPLFATAPHHSDRLLALLRLKPTSWVVRSSAIWSAAAVTSSTALLHAGIRGEAQDYRHRLVI